MTTPTPLDHANVARVLNSAMLMAERRVERARRSLTKATEKNKDETYAQLAVDSTNHFRDELAKVVEQVLADLAAQPTAADDTPSKSRVAIGCITGSGEQCAHIERCEFQCVAEPPNCGACPGDGSVCEGECRVEGESPPVSPSAPLNPRTADLVKRFMRALSEKLAAAERKYGYSDNWALKDWREECQRQLLEHVAKGDPRDVAAYCAFAWHHGWPTVASQPAPQPPINSSETYSKSIDAQADDDICPNCVSPWKCNGPHVGERPAHGYEDAQPLAQNAATIRRLLGEARNYLEGIDLADEIDAELAKFDAQHEPQPPNAQQVAQTGVPEGWSIQFNQGAYIVRAPNGRGAFAAQPMFNNIAATVLYELAKDLLAASPAPTKQEEGSPHDWPEDWSHENGRYECRCVHCGKRFQGHKRRVSCKQCTRAAAPAQSQGAER